jgi:hypothetical protein
MHTHSVHERVIEVDMRVYSTWKNKQPFCINHIVRLDVRQVSLRSNKFALNQNILLGDLLIGDNCPSSYECGIQFLHPSLFRLWGKIIAFRTDEVKISCFTLSSDIILPTLRLNLVSENQEYSCCQLYF